MLTLLLIIRILCSEEIMIDSENSKKVITLAGGELAFGFVSMAEGTGSNTLGLTYTHGVLLHTIIPLVFQSPFVPVSVEKS